MHLRFLNACKKDLGVILFTEKYTVAAIMFTKIISSIPTIFSIFSIFLFLGPTNSFAAASAFDHPLTIAELVDIALVNHPATRQAWWNAQRAAALLGSAKSAYYPNLGLDASVRNGRDFKFINGPDTNYTIVGADLALSMLLFDFGVRSADVEAAKTSLEAANWQGDWNIQKVMVRVLENAYAVMHAHEVLQAAEISFNEADKILGMSRELNRAGLTPISDLYTSQANLSQMKMELTLQKALYDIQKGKLAASLGLSADVVIELAALDQIHPPQQQQAADLIALAFRQRADLMAKQARLSESFSRLDKARASYGPKVSLFGTGGYNHAYHDKANGAQYQLGMNIEIPLFNGFETVYQNRIAYADTKLSMEDFAELQLQIALEVLTYSRTLQAAQEMLCEADEYLKNSTKAFDSIIEKYKAGKERIYEVSSAQQQLAAARVRFSDVKTRWLVTLANLAYATGTLAPYMETPCYANP